MYSQPGTLHSGRIDLKAEGYPFVMLSADLCRLFRWSSDGLYRRIQSGDVPGYQPRASRRARYEWHRPDVERWMATARFRLARVAS